jgi:hypothetical protein
MIIFFGRPTQHIKAGCLAMILLATPVFAQAAREKVVYSFKGAPDGSNPRGALVNVGGSL